MPSAHDAVVEACKLRAKQLGIPCHEGSPQTFAKPKQVRLEKGIPDLFVLLPRTVAWFEVKIPPDDYTPEQREFMEECLELDIPFHKIADEWEFVQDVQHLQEELRCQSALSPRRAL